MKTKKEISVLRKEIMQHASSVPNCEIAPGIILKTAGDKYVTLTSLWDGAHIIKCCYDCYEAGMYGLCNHIKSQSLTPKQGYSDNY